MSLRRPDNDKEDNSRPADVLDQAGELTQQLNDAFVANVRQAAAPQQAQRADGSWPRTTCADEDCGVPLPLARLQMGRKFCVDCQADRERAERGQR